MTVKINLSRIDVVNGMPVTYGQPEDGEELTASTAAAPSSIEATSLQQAWEIDPDVDIWAAFGDAPDASVVGKRRFLRAGMPRNFVVGVVGEKISILRAS